MNAQEIMQNISEGIQKSANVKTVFGEPYERGQVTIIPVARVDINGCSWGTIAESELEKKDVSENEGGNDLEMTISTIPLGYIEVRENEARFVEIQFANRLALAGLVLGGFAIFSLSRILIQFLRND